MEDRTMDGRKPRFLSIIDEYTRECLASIPGAPGENRCDGALADIMMQRVSEYIRSDNGPEFIAKKLRNGFQTSALSQPILNQAALGRTATARVSTAECEMSF